MNSLPQILLLVTAAMISTAAGAEPTKQADAIPLKVLAVHVKHGKKAAEFVRANTPAYLIGPLDQSMPQAALYHVDRDGVIDPLKVEPGKEYRLIVDTSDTFESSDGEVFLPAATSLRAFKTSRPNQSTIGTHLVAEAISLKDYRTARRVGEHLDFVLNTLAISNDRDCAAAMAATRQRLTDFAPVCSDAFNKQTPNRVDEWKHIPIASVRDVSENIVEVTGLAEFGQLRKQGVEWKPYVRSRILACAADGSDITHRFNNQFVTTNLDGSFKIKLPKDVCVKLIVDAEYDKTQNVIVKPPAYVDLCPISKYGIVWEKTTPAISSHSQSFDAKYRSTLFTKLFNDAERAGKTQEERDRVKPVLMAHRASQAAKSKWNLVASQTGPKPGEDWDQVQYAAEKYPSTCFWIIVKPGGDRVPDGWAKAFEPYLKSQFRSLDGEVIPENAPRTNFRIVGYVSAWRTDKTMEHIRTEISTYTMGRSDAKNSHMQVTGVFLDNLWQLSSEEREGLCTEIRNTHGSDFMIFGACGEKVDVESTEPSAAGILDVLLMRKSHQLDMKSIIGRRELIVATVPKARFGVFHLGVDANGMKAAVEQQMKAGVQFINVSDFKPQSEKAGWYDANVPLPSYFPDLAAVVNEANAKEN